MYLGFSRRDFLKASGAGLLGLFLADLRLERVFAVQTPKRGRVIDSAVELFSEPFFRAKISHLFGRDEVVEITGEVQGNHGYGNPFNSVWYQVNNEGFVYSGRTQPVETQHQMPVFHIPEEGALGEILQTRYARGEITRDQYQQILQDLN